MEKRESLRKLGLGMAMAGLAVALLSVFPAVTPRDGFPWPLLAGSAIYLPGAFMLIIGTRGMGQRSAMTTLRFVRLGFVAVLAVVLWRMMSA
ncbi:MAG: hypothetical protein IIC73_04360 [Armatimonadetes bacterium]|nr:hypothetical protein [Armatimonadota bacterium]